MDEVAEGMSLPELVAREVELVARISALSLELASASEELKQVSEAIAAQVGVEESEEGEEGDELPAENTESEPEGGAATKATKTEGGSSPAKAAGTASPGKKVTKPVKLGHYATPHTSNALKTKARQEEKQQAGSTFRTNTGKATTIKSKDPPKIRKFDHW